MNRLSFAHRAPCSSIHALALTVIAAAMLVAAGRAQTPDAVPSGGAITAGQGAISQSGNTVTVNQGSERLIARWDTFNIGRDAAVQFTQPGAQSVALNRIVDRSASEIFGSLTSNGRVFLINPSGIYFGTDASVNVGGIVASSLDIADADFLGGRYLFQGTGQPGGIFNAGSITAANGGVVALLSPQVTNTGSIFAPGGSIALAAGNKISLDFAGDGLISLSIDEAALDAQVANHGLVKADGGLAMMTARAAGELTRSVVNNAGIVEADTLVERDGRIILDGGELGITESSGLLAARGHGAGERGGSIVVTGEKVGLFQHASLDASGAADGGTINIGGGFQGHDASLRNARRTFVDSDATIAANAGATGTGGDVVVWSDEVTRFHGDISAQGGAITGDGGAVEVSGKSSLTFLGRVNASAANGRAGLLLLDPKNITVSTDTQTDGLTAGVLAFADNPTGDSIINPGTITAVTNMGTGVTLQAHNDIFVNSSIFSFNPGGSGGSLTFQAGRSIALNAAVISDNGNVTFVVNDPGASAERVAGAASFTNSGLVDAGTGSVSITVSTNPGGSAGIAAGQISANNFTIAHSGPTAGGTIDLGETNIANNLTITSNSARNVTDLLDTVIVRGTADISTGGGNIDISLPTTDFSILRTNANNVTILDTNAIQIGTTSVTGNYTLTTRGPMASLLAETMTVGGAATFTANNGGFGFADPHINFNNSNDFQGGLSLSVASAGATSTGGYAIIRDANALNISNAATLNSLVVTAGGSVTTTTVAAGTTATITSTGGAVSLGTTTVGTDLTVAASGAITDSGTLTVPQQTILTAGAANSITLDSANNNFHSMRIISANDATLVDQNAFNFGAFNTNFGGYTSHIFGALNLTAGGSITQTNSDNDGYSQITVDGASTFTANHASLPINLFLGSSDPFGGGESNVFTGGITLARGNVNTGFTNVRVRNTSSAAGLLAGLTSVGTLTDVFLRYDNAPTVTLPAMTLSGSLKVFAPSVLNTSVTPANIISQTGAIVVAGSTIMAAGSTGDIVLANPANDFFQFGISNTGARDVTLVDVNAVVLYAPGYHQHVTRNYSVTAGGNISDVQHQLGIPGTATFNAPGSNVSLTGTNAFLNILAIPAANNVTILPQNSVVLDNVAITGSLYLQSRGGGTLTQVAATSVNTGAPSTNTTTFISFNSGIALANTGNILGNLAISDAADVNIRENNPITQASAWGFNGTNGGTNSTRRAVTLTTSDDQAITLNQAGSAFGDLTITQVNNGAGSAGAVLVRETGDSYFGMTEGATPWVVHGTTTIDTGAYSATLGNANNVFGPLQVLGATGLTNSLPSAITIYAKHPGAGDAITDVGATGAWATGAVKLIAYNSTGLTAGGGNITLANASTVLGDLYLKATTTSITENDNITDGVSVSWNSAGNTGWVTTGTTNLIVANPTGKSITLDNLTNQLGPTGLNTAGVAGTLTSVLITDDTDLTQAAVWNVGAAPVTLDARTHAINLSSSGNVLGAIAINTANGSPASISITEDDAITQGSAWVLSGKPVTLVAQNNKAITLTQALNALGNLTVTGGVVSISENEAITQGGAWTTTGTTTLNAGTNAITLSNTGNVFGALAIDPATTSLSLTENADITQASAWSLATAPITLNAQTHDVLLTQAANQLGDLTLTGANATVVENHAISDASAWTVSGLTSLTAGVNAILLDLASDLGTVRINSASAATITDANAVILDTSSVTGMLSVSAGGAITQSGPITADSLRLVGSGFATLTHAGNNVVSLAAGFSGGDLSYTDADNFAVAVVGGTSGVNIGANDVTLTSIAGTITGLTNINASSTSLTVATGTALTLPQITIAGPQTYTGGSGITLTGNITSNVSGAITFNSPVILSNDWVVQSTNSNINFLGTLTGANNQLTVNAGLGQIDFAGAVSGMGATTDAAVALTVSAGGTGTTFHSTIAANNGLSVTGPVVFTDNVTLADGLVGSTFGGEVTLGKVGGMTLSGFDNFSFNGGVLLQSGAATINSNNSTLTFQGANTLHGPFGLTLNSGTQTITGLDHVGADITSLVVTANTPAIPSGGVAIAGPQTYNATGGSSITLNGPVASTASGAIIFNSPVVLGTDSTVTTVDSAISFASTLDGAHDLTLSSGAGLKTFTGKVGNISAVGDGVGASITLQGAGATTFSDTVATRSGVVAAGPITFVGNITLANGDTGSSFNGLVTTGGTTLSGFDSVAFNAGLALAGDVTVLSNGSTLSFGGAVSGAHGLTLNALTGTTGTVTGLQQIATELTMLSVTGRTLSLPSAGLAISGPMSFTATSPAAAGITLNGNVGSTSSPSGGQIDFNGTVTLATGAVTIATANADVNFSSTVTGAQNLTISTGTGARNFTGNVSNVGTGIGAAITLQGSGTSTFTGTVGTNSGLTIQNAGNVVFNRGVTLGNGDTGSDFGSGTLTIGRPAATVSLIGFDGLTFGGPFVVTAGPVSMSSNSSPIVFGGIVNGAQNLAINSGTSTIDFNAAVGGTTPIGSGLGAGLDLVSSGLTTFNSTLATTSGMTAAGPIVFADNVALGDGSLGSTFTGAVTLGKVGGATFTGFDGITFNGAVALANGQTTVTSNGSALTFNNTIDGGQALIANAGASALQFGGAVGGVTPLASLTATGATIAAGAVSTAGTQSYTGAITLNGNLTTADSDITVTGPTTLGADLTISTGAAGAGNITFAGATSTINGAHALALIAGTGNIVLGGAVGGITPLTTFSVSGNNITIPVINSTSTQTFSALNDLTLSQSRTSSVPLSFIADSDGNGMGSFILPTGVALVTSNQALNIAAADLDLQGTSTVSTGSGVITITPTNARNLFLGGFDVTALNISASELSRISTSGGLDLNTTGAGWIQVAGIDASSSQSISGVLHLFAQGSGDVSFVTSPSTFNALTVESGSGTILLGQNLTTTNDPIVFVSPVATTATVAVASGGGNITFQDTLAANNPLALSTAGGTLAFGDSVNGTSTVAIALAGGNVSGLGFLQSTLTGLTLSNNAVVTLPTFSINGPHVYNGPVSITGNLSGVGLAFNNTAQIAANNVFLDSGPGPLAFANTLTAGANNFTLTGDEINFANAITGTGNVVFQPSTFALDVVVGGSASTAGLDLTAADLAWLPSTLASLTLGHITGTGTLTLAAATNFGAIPLTLNGGGGISQSAALSAGALTLRSAAGINLSNASNSLGAITVVGSPTSVNIADSTALSQGAAWVLGPAPVTLNAGSNAITLTQSGNTFGTLALAGGIVQVTEAADTDLGASTASALTVVSTGAISSSGTLAVSGAASFKTLDDAGRNIALANSSTFGSVSAVSRNAADTAVSAGAISLSPGAATVVETLATVGDITLTSPSGGTISQSGTSTLTAADLELLGPGAFALTAGANAITTLAGNTGNVAFRDDSGFAIGTVNTVGLTSSGNLTLSSTGIVTQSQNLVASGLELLGAGGAFTLTNIGNAIATLAGNTGSVAFRDDSGFAIGTVNTIGLATSGNTTLSSTGAVTQAQRIAASGLELLGAGGVFTLSNVANTITTLAGNTGTIRFLENSGFAVGTVNTTGLTASGNVTLSSTGAVTQAQDISAAGVELLGAGGAFTLTRATNSIPILATNTGSASVQTSGALVIGTVNSVGATASGNLALTAGGIISQSAPLAVGGSLTLATTHNAGDVAINNTGANATITGNSQVGGNYVLTAVGDVVSQAALTSIQVVGDLTVVSGSTILDAAGNLIGGDLSASGSGITVRSSGVITLNNETHVDNFTVISEAATRSFDVGGPITGSAIDLNDAANNIAGPISITTQTRAVISGPDGPTGIQQAGGTTLNIGGVASFTAEPSSAGSIGVVLTNAGNVFGALSASGNIVDLRHDSTGTTTLNGVIATTRFNLLAAGPVAQAGAIVTPELAVVSPGAVTLGDSANQVGTLAIDAGGNIAFTDADSFVIGTVGALAGINAHGNDVTLKTGATGAITQTAALQNVDALTLSAGNAITLTGANTITSLAGASSDGHLQITDSAGGLVIDGPVLAVSGNVTVRTSGDLTLNPGSTVAAAAGDVYLSAEGTGNFINNAGASALTVGSGNRWLVYSKTPDLVGTVHTVKGGLTSAFRLYGRTFATDNPASIASLGNGFIYADSPSTTLTISPTIVGTPSHVYGDNPTATLGVSVSSGFIDSEDTALNIGLTGTALFDLALANTMNAGPYLIHYTGGLSSSYTLIADTAGVGYTVTQALLTYVADAASRIYGDANPTFSGTLTGFKLGQDASVLGGSAAWNTMADTASHVGGYAVNGSGYTSANYTFAQAAGNATALSVTARPITLTTAGQSRFYGNANPTTGGFSLTSGNLVNSDTLAAALTVASPATLTSNVGSYALTPSASVFTAGLASDYAITYADGSLAVAARPISLTADNQSRIYGNANPTSGTFTIGGSGLANSDALAATLNVSSPALATSNVGNYALTPGSAVFTSGLAGNYAITYLDGILAITSRGLTITANNQSRFYGNPNPTTGSFTVSGGGLVNSDVLDSAVSVTSPATLASHVGSFTLSPGAVNFTSGSASNYTINYADGALQVTARPLTVTADNQNRAYGDANPTTGTFATGGSGLANGDALASLLNVSSLALATSNVGNFNLMPSGAVFTTGAASDYLVTYVDGTLTVGGRPITITANDQTRIYGNANATTGTFVIGGRGLVNSDAINPTVLVSTPATPASHVGGYALTPGTVNFTGGAASNYTITYVDGSLVITPRALSLTADNQSRIYGDANPASGSFVVGGSGLANSDALAATLTLGSNAVGTSNVGTYVLTPSNPIFTTGEVTDYAITYVAGSLAVLARPITITAGNQGRGYGDANPTLGGFTVGGSGLANSDALSATIAVSSPATLTSNIGDYALVPGSISFTNGSSSNYAINYANGILSITPAALTYTANPGTRIYGDGNPAFSGTLTGFKNTDTLATTTSGTLSFDSATTVTSNVGSYAVIGSGITANGGNYVLVQAPGNATALTITPRALTVSGSDLTRVYGDANPTTTLATATGLVNGDSVSSAGVTFLATVTTSVGTYTSMPGTTAFTTGLASNYTIAYVNGVLTITPRPLTITAGNQSKVYGEANPTTGVVTANNLVNGDTLGISLVSSAATASSNVGSYGLTPASAAFTQGSAGNYTITYANGALFVTVRPVTVTADAQTKVYGSTDPALTYQVEGQTTGRGMLTGQTMGGALGRTAGESVAGGPYAITQGSLASTNSNYAITYVGRSFAITPATLTYVADAFHGAFPSSLSLLTGLVRGFLGADSLANATTGTAAWNTDAIASSIPGSYTINGSGLQAVRGNYVFVQDAGNATALTLDGSSSTSIPRPFIPTFDSFDIGRGGNGSPTIGTAGENGDSGIIPRWGDGLFVQTDGGSGLLTPASFSGDWVSIPDDAGEFTGLPLPRTSAGTSAVDPAGFASEGSTSTLSFNTGAPSHAPAENLSVSLYLQSNGRNFPVGRFEGSHNASTTTMTLVQDEVAPVPVAAGVWREGTFLFDASPGDSVAITVSLSEDGLLTVRISSAFIEAKGVRNAALAGIVAAKKVLGATMAEIKVVIIVAR